MCGYELLCRCVGAWAKQSSGISIETDRKVEDGLDLGAFRDDSTAGRETRKTWVIRHQLHFTRPSAVLILPRNDKTCCLLP
jgi:hypothetical protein